MSYENRDYLTDIETCLLPFGTQFSEQQKSVLENNSSANIIAGPGSGKTTVLIAKCALLLKENMGTKNGVCLITHTNVAVDEIREGLNKIGFKDIDYPNFIGTIQEFINHFFGRKAFHLLLKDKKMRVLDEEEYKGKFDNQFSQLKPDWYTANPPNPKYRNPKINISNELKISISSNATSSYRDAFNWSVERLIKSGIVTNEQCLELAEWYIDKYLDGVRMAIKNRFKYVLLDEAQDTNMLQLNILNKVFLNNVIFQRFGDPYQSLYTIFSNEEDAWVPSREEIMKLEISETARFSEKIARYVRNVAIENYENFSSISPNNSYSPYFLSYKTGNELIEKYNKLIEDKSVSNPKYKDSIKKDAIVSLKHDDLSIVFESYEKEKIKVKKSQSFINQIYQFTIKIIASEKDMIVKDIEEIVNSNQSIKRDLAIGIKNILSKSEDGFNIVLSQIEKVANVELTDVKKSLIKNYILDIVKNNADINQSIETTGKEIYVGTIHSVKGETHRSTLLLLNSVFKDFNETYNYNIIELLKEYITDNYIDLDSIQETVRRRETKKALKLAYVAFSRPTHLLAIGIEEALMNQELKDSLIQSGWQEI